MRDWVEMNDAYWAASMEADDERARSLAQLQRSFRVQDTGIAEQRALFEQCTRSVDGPVTPPNSVKAVWRRARGVGDQAKKNDSVCCLERVHGRQ